MGREALSRKGGAGQHSHTEAEQGNRAVLLKVAKTALFHWEPVEE